ncbi:MAG: phosphotransferase, partial [Actinomycetota bacterium]
ADRSGRVLGALGPRAVPMPWWQEAGPIVDAVPGVTVLRLLHGEPDPDLPMGGSVTYLVEVEDDHGLDLEPWPGPGEASSGPDPLADHPLRHPWARPGGPAADHRWVAGRVAVTGPPRQHRTWNLSAIWSYPTADGRVWLKCVPPFFAHEAAVIELLDGEDVPRVLAADGPRILLAELGGRDGYDASDGEQMAMLDALVDLQLRAGDRADAFVAAGVPDLRTGVLGPTLAHLVERLVPVGDPRHRPLQALVDELPDRLARVDADGPASTVVHGDAHGGNCRLGAERPIWFDWGDAFIGSPLLDLVCDWDKSTEVRRHWLARWADHAKDVAGAWEAIVPIALLRQAWVYQRFCDNIEPSEQVYHRDDVPAALDTTIAALG